MHICDSGMTPACRGFVLVVSILCPEITCTCMPMLLVQVGCTKHVYDDSSSSFQLKMPPSCKTALSQCLCVDIGGIYRIILTCEPLLY